MVDLTQALPSLASAVLFGTILIWGFRAGKNSTRYRLNFRIIGAAGIAWTALQIFATFTSGDILPREIVSIGLAALLTIFSIAYQDLTRKFLKRNGLGEAAWTAGAIWVLVLLTLYFLSGRLVLPDVGEYRPEIVLGLLVATWGLVSLKTFWILYQDYRRVRQPLHRNRIAYWVASSLVSTLGGISLIWGYSGLGLLLAALTGLSSIMIAQSGQLPDIRGGSLRLMANILNTSLLLVVNGLVYMLTLYVVQIILGQNAVMAGLAMAAVLTFVFRPVFGRLEGSIRAWLGEEPSDRPSLVRDFVLATANIIDLESLVKKALRLVEQALEARSSLFFLVTFKQDGTGAVFNLLSPVPGGSSATTVRPGVIPAAHPLGLYLNRQQRPITQFAIDQMEDSLDKPHLDHAWFGELHMDVHVPIRCQGTWIGLLSVGPKETGLPYSDTELGLLQIFGQKLSPVIKNILTVQEILESRKSVETAISDLSRSHNELKRIDKAKSDFIHLASHELRNPLSVVYGYAQMLEDAPALRADDYYRSLIGGIHNSSERLEQIVDNLLEVAKIDTDALELAPLPLPLPSIFDSLQQRFEKICRDRNLVLEIKDMKSLPPVDVDREGVQKVFYNLLVNAVKFTPDGGRITISGSFLSSKEISAREDCVRVTVEDSGVGIDPEQQKILFEKFQTNGAIGTHSPASLRFKEVGPGLGLAIAQKVVESHGGRIWVESQGHDENALPGSRFHVLLPVRQARRAVPA